MKYRSTLLILTAAASALAQTADVVRPELNEQVVDRLRRQHNVRLRRSIESLETFRRTAGLGSEYSFRNRRVHTDVWGDTHARFDQHFQGVRILGSVVITHMNAQRVLEEPTERSFPGLSLSIRPAIGGAEAQQRIADLFRRTIRGTVVEPAVKLELVIVPGTVPYLAYLAEATAQDRMGDVAEPRAYLMNANTGDIADSWPLSLEALPIQAPPDDLSHRYGTVHIGSTYLPNSKLYELRDSGRSNNSVRNLQFFGIGQGNQSVPFRTATDQWGDGIGFDYANETDYGSRHGQTQAVTVAFGIQHAYDMLKNVFQYQGLDGEGTPITAYVHTSKPDANGNPVAYTDARWSGGAAWFGTTAIDIVGHELGHGLLGFSLGSIGGGEAKGLNEGHGDIMGSLAEFYYLGSNGLGTKIIDKPGNWNFMSRMIDPSGYSAGGQTGLSYYVPDMATREEHVQGCAYGHAFIFLARGATSDQTSPLYSTKLPLGMAGIGLDKAARIWFRATTAHLVDTPTFLDMRKAYEQAAAALYGNNSAELKAVKRAFWGINVGTNPDGIIVNP